MSACQKLRGGDMDGYGISFRGDESVLKLITQMVT